MTDNLRIAILGAGAMGGLYAWHFHRAPGFDVALVASGERAGRLRRDGLVVNGDPVAFQVFEPRREGEEPEPADLVIVAVKQHHLEQALDDVAPLVGEDTVFLSVLNGLDSEAVIAGRFGAGKVLYCIALAMDATREGNRITFQQPGRLHFGEARNTPASAKVRRVQEMLDRAGLAWQTPEDMLHAMWWKFMVNVGINQASAVMRASYGVFNQSADARALMDALIGEVIAVSGPAGVPLGQTDLERWYEVLAGQPAAGKTSMLQDVEAGRATEVDIFAGKVIELGERYGVETPYNRAVYHILRVLSGGTG
ncbi:MAG TPA: 2-dehydropantoate 2-reductase [Arenicellales bacterium]|nr:2-dehydropantoate 2-reductase [Arenicellales bacterium]